MLKIGHEIVRPGKNIGDDSVTIPVPEELETVPGVPKNQREVDWYAREYPLETMNITERASRDWANSIRDQHVEMREIRKEHDKLNKSLIMAARLTGDQEPTAEPTGEDVSELIKTKARELGFVEVGMTSFDLHYTYQSKKDFVKYSGGEGMLKIGHEVVRPGKNIGDDSVTIPVPEELETVPGVPKNQREVDWYAREYPLETMNITERASRDWANSIRDQHVEMREIRKEHDKLNKSLIMAARLTGDQEPTAEPTGEDVSELIKTKARELGFVEVGMTSFDLHYTYQSKKDFVKFPHVICLAYEQDFEPVLGNARYGL